MHNKSLWRQTAIAKMGIFGINSDANVKLANGIKYGAVMHFSTRKIAHAVNHLTFKLVRFKAADSFLTKSSATNVFARLLVVRQDYCLTFTHATAIERQNFRIMIHHNNQNYLNSLNRLN